MQGVHLNMIDYAILSIYFIFVIGIGWALRPQMNTSSDIFLSGRAFHVGGTSHTLASRSSQNDVPSSGNPPRNDSHCFDARARGNRICPATQRRELRLRSRSADDARTLSPDGTEFLDSNRCLDGVLCHDHYDIIIHPASSIG
jgi:hypothetical protein